MSRTIGGRDKIARSIASAAAGDELPIAVSLLHQRADFSNWVLFCSGPF